MLILTRELRKRQKEALALGIAIALRVSGPPLRHECVHERPKRNAQTAIFGGTFGHGEIPGRIGRRRIDRIIRLGHEFAELIRNVGECVDQPLRAGSRGSPHFCFQK
jgi:hypothetical protein